MSRILMTTDARPGHLGLQHWLGYRARLASAMGSRW